MTDAPFEVVFLPEGSRYLATAAVPLYLAAAGAGILVEQPCGSQGICGHCRVRVVAGDVAPGERDEAHLAPDELFAGWRLACQMILSGPATIEVPAVTRSLAGKSFGGELSADALARPVIQALALSLPAAAAPNALDRLGDALGHARRVLHARPSAAADLSVALGVFRQVFVALDGEELLTARAGGRHPLFGLALDIGTTSLAAAVVDLDGGLVAASAARLNPQVAFGADVIARIQHTMDDENGLRHLTDSVRGGIQSLIAEVTASCGCSRADIVCVAVAGNPTMIHAWVGADIRSLGIAPYVGTFAAELHCKASEVGLGVHPNANVYVFPQVQSHVGADAVAAAIACGLDLGAGRRLLVDLGTNSEILVTDGERVVATSAAAGPAFEGVSIRHGMRAAPGAVDVVSFEDGGRVLMSTVGSAPAAGLCGSGLIDLLAEMLRVGLVSPTGYLRCVDELAGRDADSFGRRLVETDGQRGFRLSPDPDLGWTRDILFTAKDIREVQLAKGSIMTAAALACRHLGFGLADLDEVLVAGAFGNFIRKSSALGIGLVPAIDAQRIRPIGNAAGVGARLALLDRQVRRRAARLAERAEYLDLATTPDYQATLMASLAFP